MLYFVLGRPKPKQPVKLDLKMSQKSTDVELSDEKTEKERVFTAKDVTPVKTETAQLFKKGTTVFFMYNGHEWEAFEVLGLPKACDIQTATSHYQNLIKTSDPSTFEFYELAYSAILKANQK